MQTRPLVRGGVRGWRRPARRGGPRSPSRPGRGERSPTNAAVAADLAAAREAAGEAAASAAAAVNVRECDVPTLLTLYSDLCAAGRLRDALDLVEHCAGARRSDMLKRLRHKHFLSAAAAAASPTAAALALRFVAALPRGVADARTHTLAVSAAAAARCSASVDAARAWLAGAGVPPDTILYTALVAGYAAAGDADAAFGVYAEMREAGVRTEPQVYSALVAACARAMAAGAGAPGGRGAATRRACLVLLERASAVLDDMTAARVRPDAPVWNALIGAAGRAGALQRAFSALEDMKAAGLRPDERTYAALIDGCSRAGRQDLAVRVYHTALRAGLGAGGPLLYTATVAACRGGGGSGHSTAAPATATTPASGDRDTPTTASADLPTALDVYRDLERAGVAPDALFYSALIAVAGAARDVATARAVAADAASDGVGDAPEVTTALVCACVDAGELDAALAALQAAEAGGERPLNARAYSAVINAAGVAFRLSDAVAVLARMADARVAPDAYTVAALLNGLQRAGEAEAAFDVFFAARARGVPVDDALAFILVRLCYNKLRAAWFPGGYPPGRADAAAAAAGGEASAPLRAALAAALGVRSPPPGRGGGGGASDSIDWATRALGVYRDALECGVRPSLRLLDRVLACLRLPPGAPSADRGRRRAGERASADRARGSPTRAVFDARALPIVDDAIAAGVLPPVSLPPPAPRLDLRGLPPAVAEVYVLAVTAALARLVDGPPRSARRYSACSCLRSV